MNKGQFRPGQSGNPKGRPIGVGSLSTIARKLRKKNLNEMISILTEHVKTGPSQEFPPEESFLHSMARKLIERAHGGDLDAFKVICEFIFAKLPKEEHEEFSEEDIELMQIAKKIREEEKAKKE